MRSYLTPLCAITALGLTLGLALDSRRPAAPLTDQRAPAFTLPQLHDPRQTLSIEALRGQVVVLNLWASWCVACREEHPLLLALARADRVRLYGINYKDRREDAVRWLDYYGDPYRASATDAQGQLGSELGVYGIPETFVIDKQGVIRYRHVGPITEQDWRQNIRPLLQRLEATT